MEILQRLMDWLFSLFLYFWFWNILVVQERLIHRFICWFMEFVLQWCWDWGQILLLCGYRLGCCLSCICWWSVSFKMQSLILWQELQVCCWELCRSWFTVQWLTAWKIWYSSLFYSIFPTQMEDNLYFVRWQICCFTEEPYGWSFCLLFLLSWFWKAPKYLWNLKYYI